MTTRNYQAELEAKGRKRVYWTLDLDTINGVEELADGRPLAVMAGRLLKFALDTMPLDYNPNKEKGESNDQPEPSQTTEGT